MNTDLDDSLDNPQPVHVNYDPIKDFLDSNPTIDELVHKIENERFRLLPDDIKKILAEIKKKIYSRDRDSMYGLLPKLAELENNFVDKDIKKQIRSIYNKIYINLKLKSITQKLQKQQQQQQPQQPQQQRN
jgi:hypothetical protein